MRVIYTQKTGTVTSCFTAPAFPGGDFTSGEVEDYNIYLSAPSAPEIQVLAGATDITDGTGLVNFGSTPQNTVITKTFTIKNIGTSDLTLGALSALPNGFSLVGTFPTVNIPAAGSATFSVKLNATSTGTYSGVLSFVNGDADENPFNYNLSGTVTATSVGLDEITVGKNISIYPNPAKDQITISTAASLKNASVSIFDMTGRLVHEKNNLEGKSNVIDISNYDSGIYFFEINQSNEFIRAKVIKE
jgi:hypothetical protein